MAHWAQIDENSIVIKVTVGDNNDPAGDEGYSWLIENIGGTWIKTSYNSRGGVHLVWGEAEKIDDDGKTYKVEKYIPSGQPHLRYNFAGIGFLYDPIRDAFIPPKPEDYIDENGQSFTFILNEETCLWEPVIVQ